MSVIEQDGDSRSRTAKVFDFVERHNKTIVVIELVVIAGFMVKPKVTMEIARYRELQINAYRAAEAAEEASNLVMMLGDLLYDTGELRNVKETAS
jgi:hypothetical protein